MGAGTTSRTKLLAIIAAMAVCLGLGLALHASAYEPGLGNYTWDSNVPNYNPSAVIYPGTIDISGLIFGDFVGLSPTQPNASLWGDMGVSRGWDDNLGDSGGLTLLDGDPNTNADTLDGKAINLGLGYNQTTGEFYGCCQEGWWDLGAQTNRVVVFLPLDHGPYLGHGLNAKVYGSNTLWGSVSSQAVVKEIYLDGWRPHNPAEDVTSLLWGRIIS